MTRKIRKSMIGVVAAASSLTMLLAACAGGETGSAGSSSGTIAVDIVGGGSTIPNDDVIKKKIDEQLGTDLRVTAVAAQADYDAKLAAALASGNGPDLFQVNRGQLQHFVKQGLVLDLTSHLDSDLKEYTGFVGKGAMKVATLDGKVYGFVKRRPAYNYGSYWIRKDWLDELNLSVPKNTEDLYAVARAFTTRDPDGNGKDDTYGFTGGKDLPPWTPLWAGFGSCGNQGGLDEVCVVDGQVVTGYTAPGTKDALAYLHRLVAEKLVDPDTFSSDSLQGHQRALQGKAGLIYQGWPQMTKPQFVDQYKKAQPKAEWIQLGPPAGPAGPGALGKDGSTSAIFAIPASVGKDDAKLTKIFELLNYISTPQGNRLVSYGIEGEHYTVEGDSVVATDKLTSEGEYFWLYQFSGRQEKEYLAAKFPKVQQEIEFAQNQPMVDNFGSLVVQPEGFRATDAHRYAEEQVAQFISGKRPLDQYDAFVDELLTTYGYQLYLDAATQQLKELDVIG